MRSSQIALLAGLATYSQQQTVMVDITRPLVPMEDYTPPDHFDNDPNYYYPTDYRILNCWECFEAQGKICIDSGHNSLYYHTKSSDPGNAFCCKPDSNEGYCKNGNVHDYDNQEEGITTVCSEPSKGLYDTKFSNILTNNRNHQMFAYCPAISHQKCGITSDKQDSHDMRLKAGLSKTHVQSNEMRYKKPNPQDSSREYDACYYEVVLDESVLDEYDPQQIHIQISSMTNMNVYIYGGSSRAQATESVIQGNAQATVGTTYSISPAKGFLIVAYPNEVVSLSTSSDFGFNYWLEAKLKPDPEEEDSAAVPVIVNDSGEGKIVIEKQQHEDDVSGVKTNTFTEEPSSSRSSIIPGQEDDLLFYGLCGAAGILFLAIVVLCLKCRRKGKITTHGVQENIFPNVSNQGSMHLEDVDEEDYRHQDETNRPSLGGKHGMMYGDEDKPQMASYKQVNAGSMMTNKEEATEDD